MMNTSVVIPAGATISAAIIAAFASRDRQSLLIKKVELISKEAEPLSKLEESPLKVMLVAKIKNNTYQIVESEELGPIICRSRMVILFGVAYASSGLAMICSIAPHSWNLTGWMTLIAGTVLLILGLHIKWRLRRARSNFRSSCAPPSPLEAIEVALISERALIEKLQPCVAELESEMASLNESRLVPPK